MYILGNYGKATVVFDDTVWQHHACAKDHAHMGLIGGKVRTAVHFIVIITLRTKKEEFPSNQERKHIMFTAMLFRSLEQSDCKVHQASADADLFIIQTTAASVANQDKLIFLWF